MDDAGWVTHFTWQTNDRWEYPTPYYTGLPLPSTTQWINGATFRPVATMKNGVLHLALLPISWPVKRYVKPYVGTLISNMWVPGGDQRATGYWEFIAAVQQVPGFACQWTLLDSPYSASVMVRFDIRIYTDGSNNQWVIYQDGVTQATYSTATNKGFDARLFHTYGFEKTGNSLSFYLDRKLVCSAPFSNSDIAANALFTSLSTVSADYFGGLMPDAAALPAFAQIDSYNIFDVRPF
jgi:hypothetical protein